MDTEHFFQYKGLIHKVKALAMKYQHPENVTKTSKNLQNHAVIFHRLE